MAHPCLPKLLIGGIELPSEVAAAILGGVAGGVLTLVGQWFVGPRMDGRIRAQERWEQFLIELATLMTGPGAAEVRRRAESAWMTWHHTLKIANAQGVPTTDAAYEALGPEQREEVRARFLRVRDQVVSYRDAFERADDEWSQSVAPRVAWLVRRIVGPYEYADASLRQLETQWMLYDFRSRYLTPYDDVLKHGIEVWDEERNARKALVATIETLSERIGPPARWSRRMRVALQHARKRLIRPKSGS
jgi:hypothetical protein